MQQEIPCHATEQSPSSLRYFNMNMNNHKVGVGPVFPKDNRWDMIRRDKLQKKRKNYFRIHIELSVFGFRRSVSDS